LKFCVTTDVYLFSRSDAKLHAYTASVEFPQPNKKDRFVHNDRDRKTELLSLSLRYSARGSDKVPREYF
jgi:hypothetical protein